MYSKADGWIACKSDDGPMICAGLHETWTLAPDTDADTAACHGGSMGANTCVVILLRFHASTSIYGRLNDVWHLRMRAGPASWCVIRISTCGTSSMGWLRWWWWPASTCLRCRCESPPGMGTCATTMLESSASNSGRARTQLCPT